MSSFVFLAIGVVIATFLSYLSNELPGIQAIPGRNGHIFRLIVWIVALSIVLGAWEAAAVTLPWLKETSLILGTLVVFDGGQLGWKCWQYQRRLTKARRAADDTEPSVLPPEPDSGHPLSSRKTIAAPPPLRLPGQRTAEYLRRQARRCEEYEVEEYLANPTNGRIQRHQNFVYPHVAPQGLQRPLLHRQQVSPADFHQSLHPRPTGRLYSALVYQPRSTGAGVRSHGHSVGCGQAAGGGFDSSTRKPGDSKPAKPPDANRAWTIWRKPHCCCICW